jgi:hypothetical protein
MKSTFMLKTIISPIIISLALIASSLNAEEPPMDLSQFRWNNRLLLLFAPNRSHSLFDELQKSIATQQAEVADRDLVIFEILESGTSRMDTSDLDTQAAQSLRDKFDVNPGRFALILVGKDGSVKLNRQEQTRLEDIFALIDAMPMRREEMRQKSQTGESDTAAPNKSGGTE